jgi:outer membrane immunogenic protein
MSKKLLIAAAAVAISSGAMAQSAFEGFYGQLGVGYENNSFANKTVSASDSSNALSAPSQSAGGFSGAIGLGYNYAVAPNLVLGLGVDYNPLSVKSGQNAIGNGMAGGNTTTQASNRYNIFVTPGYQFGADKLGYIKLGYSAEQLKAQNSGAVSGNTLSGSGTANASGYIVGLGYKQLIDKNIYVFGEANYMTYSNTKVGTGSLAGASVGINTTPSTYQALVGIGYKF